MVDVVNKQPVIKKIDFEVIENDRFENMVEIVNVRQMLDVLWKCAQTMTAMVKPSAQIKPFHVSTNNEICFILFFCNCLKTSVVILYFFFFFFAIAAVRDSPVLNT